MKSNHIPKRLCIGCEQFKEKQSLLRVVLTPDLKLMIDRNRKTLGRGAYLCFSKNCFEKAYKAKRLERSLKRKIDESVYEALKTELKYD